MFKKKAHTDQKMSIEALNLPKSWAWSLYNTSRIKVASIDKSKDVDLGGFDLSAAIEKNPENLFVKVFAIKANEVNDNGDCFSIEELKKGAASFVGVPVFVNHQNDNVENARGKVVHAWYDEPSKGIYCINMVDRSAYPRLARGIEEGYITGTSMGAQVGHSVCSICHNKAHTADEFCTHIKNGKNRKLSGKYDCKFHDSSCKPEEPCPVDGKKKSESKEMIHKEARVYEWNYDIKFIEDSFVVNPACHSCLVCEILTADLETKVSTKIAELQKIASVMNDSVSKMNEGSLEKTAGQSELQALTQAMNLMEHVARSMMAQKNQVQLDYVSDLVEQLAKVQSLTDELVEMGYAQLASPPEHQIALGNIMTAPVTGQSQQVMNPQQVGGQGQAQPQPEAQSGKGSPPSSASLDGLGSVTRPTFTGASEELKKEFLKQARNKTSQLERVSSALQLSLDLFDRRRVEVANSEHVAEVSEGNLKVTVASAENNETVVGKWKDNKLVSWASAEEFGDELKALITSNPQEAAKTILSQYQKESGVTMSHNTTKTAAGSSAQQEVTTQKQLENAGPLHPREDKAPTVTTQAQLEGKGELKDVNDTTSDNNALRKDAAPEVITQAQLESIDSDHAVRWNEYPEVITEAQWTEMSRRVSSSLGSDYTDKTTEAQLVSLQSSHKWTAPETVTQDQLNGQKKVSPEGKSDSARWASSAKDLVKAASSAVADAIANYGLTPTEISAAVRQITASPQSAIKASYLTLVNAAPTKTQARVASRKRRDYFAKSASISNNLKPIDSFISAMADNIGYLKGEDFVDAIQFVVTDKKAFASAESSAHTKIASREDTGEVVVDKASMFRQAFAELDRPEDGLYKLCGTLKDDVTADPANKSEFMKSLLAFAKQNIDVPFVIANVNLDKEAGIFEVECKEERVCSDEEKKAFASAVTSQFKTATAKPQDKTARSTNRANLVKEAQMMGGQMGGGMGGGGAQGGAGATMPGADMGAGGMPPAENLGGQPGDLGAGEEDPMGGDDSDMQPKPPGTLCGMCGSTDVDVLDGKSKCNNCGAEVTWKIIGEWTKAPGILDSGAEDTEEGLGGEGMGEEESGEGFALPDPSQAQESIPVAAMVQLNSQMVKKASEDFKAKGLTWSLGGVSPFTGSSEVMKIADNKFLCLDTGKNYEVHLRGVKQAGKQAMFAEWRFDARPTNLGCPGCHRTKKAFASALKTHGLSEDVFDAMQLADKGKTILAMKNKGLFVAVKTASANESVLAGLKKTAGFGDKFPIETCRMKIARKYGENALALSGPCEGKNLADCVCQKLSTAGVYSNDIAIKVASVWAKEDQMVECVEDFVRTGLTMKKACFVCDQIKAKYAQFEDHISDELGGGAPEASSPEMGGGASPEHPGMGGGDEFGGDVDPFADPAADPASDPMGGDVGGGDPMAGGAPGAAMAPSTITVELPLNVLEQLEGAIGKAKGEDPMGNPAGAAGAAGGMDSGMGGDMGGVDGLPGQSPEGLDQAAGNVLDTALDATQEIGGAMDGAAQAVEQAVGEAPGVPNTDPVSLEDDAAPGEGESEVSAPEFGGESSESEPEEGGSEESSEGGEENSEEKEDSAPDFGNKEGEESHEHHGEHVMAQAESATRAFKKAKISATGEINLDLSHVMQVLAKNKKTAGEVSNHAVQDDPDIGKVKDGGTMGNEEKFDASKPDVFTGKATMGGEADAGYNNDKPKASFESGGAEMGDEKAQGYTAEKQNQATGGDKGQGNISASTSTKARTASLAERLVNIATKTASDKKLETHKPISEDGDTKPYAANKDNPKSGNPITPQESADIGKIEAGDSSFMGHEKETLVSVPKEENSAPSIPAGGGTNPKYDQNTKNAPEKETAHKGTVIAKSNEESSAARKEAATRIAGRKLKAGIISIENLSGEIEKLARYEPSDLKDLETALFGASKKGLDTVAKGSERALVISEKSNQRKSAADELKDSIQTLFTLNRNNSLAQEDPTAELRRNHNRR